MRQTQNICAIKVTLIDNDFLIEQRKTVLLNELEFFKSPISLLEYSYFFLIVKQETIVTPLLSFNCSGWIGGFPPTPPPFFFLLTHYKSIN